MKPTQRARRPGLGDLEGLARAMARPIPQELPTEANAVWRFAEQRRESLDEHVRSALGIFYTPPAIADRLLNDLAAVGARFDGTHVFCDPACGGGAFLLPVARRVADHLTRSGGSVQTLAQCLIGIDIDEGGVAITRSALDALARDRFGETATWNLQVANTLRLAVNGRLPQADVVVGNPPFGRVRLTESERAHFAGSLRGHANLYGMFLDVALAISRDLVGYVMPTSWLAGNYFSALRDLIDSTRPLASLRFIESRSAVFVGVLQEMCLAMFHQRSSSGRPVAVYGDVLSDSKWTIRIGGASPWFIPRRAADAELLAAASESPYRLVDFGYRVHTGPLVWNRHRPQLRDWPADGTTPIVWADAISPLEDVDYRRSKRPHLHFAVNGMDHLLLRRPAVLVKRTTAKEQSRRLIAAPFRRPPVVVENHLNVVRAEHNSVTAPVELVSALLNSLPVDRIFRSVSGSVAVSATELAALPLPPPSALKRLSIGKRRDDTVARAYLATRPP